MSNFSRALVVSLLLLIATAIPVAASICSALACSMDEASDKCAHMPVLEPTGPASHEMECCQEDGAPVSSFDHGVDECGVISEQGSLDAIALERHASPDPPGESTPSEDVSKETVAAARGCSDIQEAPRPATALFTLHNVFLI